MAARADCVARHETGKPTTGPRKTRGRTSRNYGLSAPIPFQNAPDRELPEVLDVDQTAAYIGMSRKWIYRHYEIMPHIRVGFGRKPRLKFRRRDLDTWLKEHRVEPK